MAAEPEGKELKLYSQFQTEQTKQNPFEGDNWTSYFGPSDSFLSFCSPVESELGSYEIESDKADDYTAELSRRMAQYMLQDEDNSSTASSASEIQNKSWGLAGSPISTLWSPLCSSNGSSHGSPEGPSKEPSPPTTPMVADRGGLDISHNVFSKLEKMKKVSTDGETGSSSSKDQARAPKNQKRKQNQNKQSQSQSQLQFMKQRGPKPGGSSGTGVFLPRHVNYNRPVPSPQPPKKKGSSTVLIPVRVLQALQLHYDRMDDETRQKSLVSQQLEKQWLERESPHMARPKPSRERRRRRWRRRRQAKWRWVCLKSGRINGCKQLARGAISSAAHKSEAFGGF